MPLTSHGIEGDERSHRRSGFMLNDDQVVLYQISDAALDELAGVRGTESRARLAQYLSLRRTIEQAALGFSTRNPSFGSVVKISVKSGETTPIGLKLTFDGDS